MSFHFRIQLAAVVAGLLLFDLNIDVAQANVKDVVYTEHVRPILQKYCFGCHGEKSAKSGLRLDTLGQDLQVSRTAASWKDVSERIVDRTESSMPPADHPRPTEVEIKTLRDWIGSQLEVAKKADAEAQKSEGRAQIRRLNRVEYNNTLRDLLAIDIDLKPLLPDDEVVAGFDNVSSGLQITRIHQERYLEAAETALNAAIILTPRPASTTRRLAFRKDGHPPRQVLENDSVVFISSSTAELQQSRVAATGHYRIRISCAPHRHEGKPLVVYINCGNPNHPDERYCAVAADKTTILEFTARMSVGNTVRIAPYGFGVNYIKDVPAYQGPGLAVDWIEVEGPITERWPPESHQRLLGAIELKKGTLQEVEQVLRNFIPRAFRRTVPPEKIEKYVEFLRRKVTTERFTPEDALRQTLLAVLCSPDFLLLHETPGPLDDFAIASRLSYFLWRSMPDQALINLANEKKLRTADELRRQVERMLHDPKATALSEQFLGQWLGLRQIDATAPDRILYPEFDEYLKYSMLKEPQHFFEQILKDDLSLTKLIDSDFAMLNDRLAAHYGIDGVVGPDFRRVQLPAESHRGGVMTMAAVLKVTANGTVTSPVLRGVWLLDRIMGQPLQLPSDLMVPAVEPDIRGALDIRDQLAKHRTAAQCASCHQKIDPFGFALENFDPIGGYRTNYRALGKYPKANINLYGKPVQYSMGLPVQAGDVMPNGKPFKDSDEFKKILLEDPAPVIRSVTEKLLVYATGNPIRAADRDSIDQLLTQIQHKNNGLRTLIHEVVQSELFLNK